MNEKITCPSCGIAATSGAFCRSCGTRLPDRAPTPTPAASAPSAATASAWPAWLPVATVGAIVVALAAAVAVVLLLAGGDPEVERASAQPRGVTPENVAQSTRGLYVPSQRARYTVLLPAGWTAGQAREGVELEGGLTAISAQDRGTSITVGQLTRPGRTLRADAQAFQRGLKDAGQSAVLKPVTLPGRRPAWRMTWTDGDVAGVGYVLESCDRRYLVAGRTPVAGIEDQRPRFGLVASTLQALC